MVVFVITVGNKRYEHFFFCACILSYDVSRISEDYLR